ncbi:hypothetical protein R6Q59_003402 [Mikania micrantha]
MDTNQQDQDSGNKSNSSYLCRQSSTRWTPTSDQIRILKELYYTNGIRSPNADQIQRIAARLRHFGKIEGKNVFYWFQNHKARERQKKRFIPASQPPPSTTATATVIHQSPFSDHYHMHGQSQNLPYFYNHQQLKIHATHHIPQVMEGGSSSSQAIIPAGCGYGSMAMEKNFRDFSISPGGEIHNFRSWVGVDSHYFNKTEPENETPEEEDDDGGGELSTEIETLPLFPIPGGSTTTAGDSHHDFFKMEESVSSELNDGGYYTGGNWFHSDGRTSLELSLNSYGYYN